MFFTPTEKVVNEYTKAPTLGARPTQPESLLEAFRHLQFTINEIKQKLDSLTIAPPSPVKVKKQVKKPAGPRITVSILKIVSAGGVWGAHGLQHELERSTGKVFAATKISWALSYLRKAGKVQMLARNQYVLAKS